MNGLPINKIKKGKIPRLWKEARRRRLPMLGLLELTRGCNFRCPYCYLGSALGNDEESELCASEFCAIIDQIASLGGLFLTFTGGEPFFRPDFEEIYLHAVKKGLLITIFTNAALIDRKRADFLARYPPLHLDITVPGATAPVYERISEEPGSFRRCLRAIDLLSERDISFGIKSVISRLNYGQFDALKNFARRRGKKLRFDTRICAPPQGPSRVEEYRLTPEQIVLLDYREPEKWNEWKKFHCRLVGPLRADRLYKCGGGLCSFHVSSRGELGVCALDTNFRYDLRAGSFREGWEDFILSVRDLPSLEKTECADCELLTACGNCPAWSTRENGSPEKPVDFLCRIAHYRDRMLKKNRSHNYEKKETVSKT